MSYIKTISFGFIGGIAAFILLLSLPGGGFFIFSMTRNDLVDFLGMEQTPAPTSTPAIVSPDFWQKIASDHVLSTVAVQSFKGGKIVREGSGMIISSDGIIITTIDVVAGSDVFQVLHGDKILRAQLMRYNGFKNLALLKVAATDMNVTRLERKYQFQSGQDMIVSGKIVELSRPIVFVQRGMISYVLSKDIVMDTEPSYFLSGSKVINSSGVVVGMSYLRSGTARLITAEVIDDFVKSYFQVSED